MKLRYSTSTLVERRDGVAAFEEIDKEQKVIKHGGRLKKNMLGARFCNASTFNKVPAAVKEKSTNDKDRRNPTSR